MNEDKTIKFIVMGGCCETRYFKDCFSYCFKFCGFYKGEKVRRIVVVSVEPAQIEVKKNYVVSLEFIKLTGGILMGKLIKYRKI